MQNFAQVVKRSLKAVIPPRLLEYAINWWTSRSPDRAIMLASLLPAFSRYDPILWIGCRRYTRSYYDILEQRGATCWTLDIDPDAAKWGRAGRHIVGNLLDVEQHFPGDNFQAILCNGVFGWGIDGTDDQRVAFLAMRKVLRPDGLLLLGWNTDRMPDPVATGLYEQLFRPTRLPGLSQRITIAGCTHVYDIFRAQ